MDEIIEEAKLAVLSNLRQAAAPGVQAENAERFANAASIAMVVLTVAQHNQADEESATTQEVVEAALRRTMN